MLRVLYRIYEVVPQSEITSEFHNSTVPRALVTQDILLCETREQFKDLIRLQYGGSIKFGASRKLAVGSLYCVIITESCDNAETLLSVGHFECAYCGVKVQAPINMVLYLSKYSISRFLQCDSDLAIDDYKGLRFCRAKCREYYEVRELNRIRTIDSGLDKLEWITPESFSSGEVGAGYVYKITKRSTGEFYVGKTTAVPVFRWGQHLKSERFPLYHIADYIFEVLEHVKHNNPTGSLAERERFWIQKLCLESPDLSLNVALTAEIRSGQLSLEV